MALKKDLAAAVLLVALYKNDDEACKEFGITPRTLRNYRRKLAEDAQFAAFFHTKKREADSRWTDALEPALKQCVETIQHVAQKVFQDGQAWRNPEMLKAMAGALLILGDVQMTGKLIDARIASENRPAGEIPGQVPSGADHSMGYIN